MDVIASAPPRMALAGVGDLVSNLTATLDWQLADRLGRDRYDAFAAIIAEGAARPALDLEDVEHRRRPELMAKGLLLSGLAMAAAGTSRPCSGAEHLISHSLDAMLGDRAALHGEQVALGCLVSAAAHECPLLDELREMFARLGLPARPATSAWRTTTSSRRSPTLRPRDPTATRSSRAWPRATTARGRRGWPLVPSRREAPRSGQPPPAPAVPAAGRRAERRDDGHAEQPEGRRACDQECHDDTVTLPGPGLVKIPCAPSRPVGAHVCLRTQPPSPRGR